jgi:hypothetical protein
LVQEELLQQMLKQFVFVIFNFVQIFPVVSVILYTCDMMHSLLVDPTTSEDCGVIEASRRRLIWNVSWCPTRGRVAAPDAQIVFLVTFEFLTIVTEIACPFSVWGGPGSVVGIATGYGLDGPGIESRWGRDFPHLSRPALRSTQPPV